MVYIGSMCDSISFRGFIPPVAYLPSLAASKLPAADHPTPEAVAWVARWERLHLRLRSEDQMRLMAQIAARRDLPFVGNQEVGEFRRFGYLARIFGDRVDFENFTPWQTLAENTHFVAFGWGFAIICPLPVKLAEDTNGLTAKWENSLWGMRWGKFFVKKNPNPSRLDR